MREQLTRFFILCDQRTFSYHDTMQLAASRLIINCYFVKIAAVILSVINRNTGETLAFMKLQEKLQSNEKQEFSWVWRKSNCTFV